MAESFTITDREAMAGTLYVNVEVRRTWRFALGMWLMRLGARLMGFGGFKLMAASDWPEWTDQERWELGPGPGAEGPR